MNKLDFDLNNLVSGATYIPVSAMTKYVRDQSSFTPLREVQIFNEYNEDNEEGTRTHMRCFRPIWPLHLCPCQSMDLYGTHFCTLLKLSSKVTSEENQMKFFTVSTLWATIALLSQIQSIWDSISKVDLCTSQWERWILNILSK